MESNLTNKELIEKVSEWNRRLCKSGGKDWTLTVPADVRKDPDLLIQELCNRFEKLTEENNRLRTQNAELTEENGRLRAENEQWRELDSRNRGYSFDDTEQ